LWIRRRRRRVTVGLASAAAALVVGIVAATSWSTAGSPPIAAHPVASPSYPRPFVCGEELVLLDANGAQAGLSMTLSEAHKVGDDTGPDLAVTFAADRPLHVSTSPPRLFELLYLQDGYIVGGGPMLNQPGDLTSQGVVLIGESFDVSPGLSSTHDLGQRDALCPGLTWAQIWSHPQRYEAVLVQGPVLPGDSPGTVHLEIATLGYWPLLIARAPLS
jgi:hypothetical protein